MVFAAGTTAINIVELLHVLTVLVALAPAFVHPLLRKQMRAAGGDGHQQLVVAMAANARRLYGPALIVAGLLGIALVEMSEDAISLTEGWVIAAIVIWVAMIGILHGLIRPALKAQGAGGRLARDREASRGWIGPAVDPVHGPVGIDDLAARLSDPALPVISGQFCGSTAEYKPEILIGAADPGLSHAPARLRSQRGSLHHLRSSWSGVKSSHRGSGARSASSAATCPSGRGPSSPPDGGAGRLG